MTNFLHIIFGPKDFSGNDFKILSVKNNTCVLLALFLVTQGLWIGGISAFGTVESDLAWKGGLIAFPTTSDSVSVGDLSMRKVKDTLGLLILGSAGIECRQVRCDCALMQYTEPDGRL